MCALRAREAPICSHPIGGMRTCHACACLVEIGAYLLACSSSWCRLKLLPLYSLEYILAGGVSPTMVLANADTVDVDGEDAMLTRVPRLFMICMSRPFLLCVSMREPD